ncbi:helix-turn-helix domain-containing protein [Streptomyces sp. NPDC098789]|uniref:helix-turn-helix domain-containing protein n=1 Tax=Streptomyces sp. NPDC098789 TaxID=3366098 RepID=UPI00382A619C
MTSVKSAPGPSRSPRTRTLPEPGERKRLREAWKLTPRQVASAFGVTAATVRSWEAGRTSPTGKRREAYARFLRGLAQEPQQRAAHRAPAARSGPAGSVGPGVPAAPEAGRTSPVPRARRSPRSVPEPEGRPDAPARGPGPGRVPGGRPVSERDLGLTAAALSAWLLILVLVQTLPAVLPG